MRDFCSILLLLLAGLSAVCVSQQCAALDEALPELERNCMIVWKVQPEFNRLQKCLAGKPTVDDTQPRAVARNLLERHLAWSWHLETVALIVSLLFALWVHNNKQTAGWWASWAHPASAVLYICLLTTGLYVVLSENALNFRTMRFFVTVAALVDLHIDWMNFDGAFGWAPIRRFATGTYFSAATRAIEVSIILLVMGWINALIVVCVLVVWVVALCYYLVLPYVTLETRLERARRRRLNDLEAGWLTTGVLTGMPTEQLRLYLEEIERVRVARINPMSLGTLQSSSVIVAVLLPILLTAAQIVASGQP